MPARLIHNALPLRPLTLLQMHRPRNQLVTRIPTRSPPPRCCDRIIDVDAIVDYLPLDLVIRWQVHEQRAVESSRYTTPVQYDNSSPLATAGILDTDPERSTQSPHKDKPDDCPPTNSTPPNFEDWWNPRQEALEAAFFIWSMALKSRVLSQFDEWFLLR